jgi:hypothetical protein
MQVFIYCKITLHVSGVHRYPSSGVHKTITAASGTGHITYLSNSLPPAWPNNQLKYIGVVNLVVWPRMRPHYQINNTYVF